MLAYIILMSFLYRMRGIVPAILHITYTNQIMKKIIYFIVLLFLAAPVIQSCSSSRKYCKTSKKKMKPLKCWNAKKQKYVRC